MFPVRSQNTSNSQTHTSLAGTQGSGAPTHLTSNHTWFAVRRNSLSDDRCTSGTHLQGRALSHDHSGELTQQAFPTSREMFIDLRLFIHIKEINAKGSFLRKHTSEKDQRRHQDVLIPCPSTVFFSLLLTHPTVKYILAEKEKKKKKDWC